MLYTKQELENLPKNQRHDVASNRYLHKLFTKQHKQLLPHEIEFIIYLPPVFHIDNPSKPIFNIYELDFCAEALFKRFILTYLHHLDFTMPIIYAYRELEIYEIERDKRKFHELVSWWAEQLESGRDDPYLHEVKIEYRHKLKILAGQYQQRAFGWFLYKRNILRQQLNAFYIYFLVKSFFRSHKKNHVLFPAFGHSFSCNVYSYVHVISRHYIPFLNSIDPERSFNEDLSNLEPRNLPYSIQNLISLYEQLAPSDYVLNLEYMIFSHDGKFYILWWKYKKLNELNGQFGFEVRTVYKIEIERDRKKINHNRFQRVNSRVVYYY